VKTGNAKASGYSYANPVPSQGSNTLEGVETRTRYLKHQVNNVRRLLKREPKRLAPHRAIEGEDIVRHSNESLRLT
jgi:hypothetical protein